MRKNLRGQRRQEAMLEEDGKYCGVAAAMVGSAVIGAAGSAYSSNQNKKAAAAGANQTRTLDPRIDNILLGGTDANGLFQKWSHLGDNPAPESILHYGNVSGNYLNNNGETDLNAIRGVGQNLIKGNTAPQAAGASATFGGAAPTSTFGGAAPMSTFGGEAPASAATQINAPAQNSLNLSGAYDKFINGDAGSNPYLLKSLQAGADLSNASFNKMQGDITQNLQRNILPSIRSGAIGAGQYGGTRQAIAEGNAISDATNQLATAATQQGLANSANMIGAQAGSWNQGQDRSLNALNTLSGQQYATAAQDAQLQQANNQFNSSLKQTANAQNQQNNQFNSDLQFRNNAQNQQNNQFNSSLVDQANARNQQNSQFNASLAQANGQFNAGMQSQTNQQNNAAALSGAGLLQGLLGTAQNNVAQGDNYKINQASQLSGILYPAAGWGQSTNTTQPFYGNGVTSALGGAMSGLSLYNQFSNMGGTGSGYDAQAIRNSYSSGYGGMSNGGMTEFNVGAGTAPVNSSLFYYGS